jgi:hypothetical protein
VHIYAHADAIRDRVETNESSGVSLFAINEGPASASFE